MSEIEIFKYKYLNIAFEGVEDSPEQDKKPERDGPRGTSSEVMRIIVMVMMMVIMTVAGDNDDELIMNVNVMDQGKMEKKIINYICCDD